MEKQFWHDRWERREIGFHEKQANHMLVNFYQHLPVKPGDTVFLPLCGKTRDIAWLLGQGHRVVGAELSQTAVAELFEELGVMPVISDHGALKRYESQGVTIFVGDFFHLSADILGAVDAVYDRAAYVAMPPAMRHQYADHLQALTPDVPHLLVTFEYDQSKMDGPPFAIHEPDILEKYSHVFQISPLGKREIDGGLKGKLPAHEAAWLLTPK